MREGTVVQDSATLKRHIIDVSGSSYYRREITAAAWNSMFAPCGWTVFATVSWSQIDDEYLTGAVVYSTSTRPDGQLIKDAGPAIYYLDGGKRRHVDTVVALQSYNFYQPVCTVSTSELQSFQTGSTMRAREGTLMKSGNPIFIIDETPPAQYTKRHIAGLTAFNYYGYSPAAVRTWSSADVNSYAEGTHVHPTKGLFPDTWYKSLVTSDLTFHRHYAYAPAQGLWDAAGIGDWNNAPVYPDLVEQPPQFNDVWVNVVYRTDVPEGGWVRFLDANLQECPGGDCNGSSTWRYADVSLNHARTSPGNRLWMVLHEIGHALALTHDGIEGPPDYPCGSTLAPRTVMDYDCLGSTASFPWDHCGIEHKYYPGGWQPNSGTEWSGC